MLSRTRRLPARHRSVVETLETRTLLSSGSGTLAEAMFMTNYASLHFRAANMADTTDAPRTAARTTASTSTRPGALSRVEQATPPAFLEPLEVVSNADGTSAAIIDYQSFETGTYTATVRWDNGPVEPALIDQPGEFWHEPTIGSAYALKKLPAGEHTLQVTVTNADRNVSATTSTTFSIATIEPEESPEPFPGFGNSPDNFAPGAPDGGESLAPEETDPAPAVTDVFVSGSAWTQPFKDYVQSKGFGDATYGYRINPADNLRELPWSKMDRISVRFSEHVTVEQPHLLISGVNVHDYGTTGFTYGPATFTATWTIDTDPALADNQPLRDDKLLLHVSNIVADVEGNRLADVYQLRINALPGDADSSGKVTDVDRAEIKSRYFTSTTNPKYDAVSPYAPYSVFHDLDGSNVISATDYAQAGGTRWGTETLPPEIEPTPRVTVPASPGGFAAAAVAPKHVELFWEVQSHDETGFRIERRNAPSGTWGTIGTAAAGATRYADKSAAPATSYEYRLSAVNAAGVSAAVSASATTQPESDDTDPTVTTAPHLSVVVGPDGTATLSWPAPSPDASAVVSVEEMAEGEEGFHPPSNAASGGKVVSLARDVTYSYRLRVDDGLGGWAYSNTVEVFPTRPPGGAEIYRNELSVASTPGGRVGVFWKGYPGQQDGFIIETRPAQDDKYADGEGVREVGRAGPDQWSKIVTLPPGEQDVRVVSYNGTIRGAWEWVPLIVHPDGSDIPSASVLEVELFGESQAHVRLDSGYNNGAVTGGRLFSTAIQYSTNGVDFNTEQNRVYGNYDDGDGEWDNHFIANLTPGTTKTFRVFTADDDNGKLGSLSGAVSVDAPALAAPTGLTATPAAGYIQLAWGVGEGAYGSGFIVERRGPGDRDFIELTRTRSGEWVSYDVNVLPDADYDYRVRAFAHPGGFAGRTDAFLGYSSYASVGVRSADVVPSPVMMTDATADPSGGVNVKWGDPSSFEDGFRITRRRVSDGSTKTFEVGTDVAEFHDDDTSLVSGDQYEYAVSAFTTAGASPSRSDYVQPTGPGDGSDTVTIEAIDPTAGEAGPNPGRFIVWRAGPRINRSLNVRVSTSGKATPGLDYTNFANNIAIASGYYGEVVEIEALPDIVSEITETVMLTAGKGGSAAELTIWDGPMAKVQSVDYLPAGQGQQSTPEAEARRGTLDDLNPNGAITVTADPPPFGGGWRIFPDSPDFIRRADRGMNIVRVRAKLATSAAGVPVYFRSFDVDDPATKIVGLQDRLWHLNEEIDSDSNGSDNRGGVGGDALDQPVKNVVANKSKGKGYQGRMRAVGKTSFATEGEVVMGRTKLALDGNAYAEAELAVSFAPGDNFRVVASTDPTRLANLSAASVPTSGNLTTTHFGAAVSPQLSVWRRLHIERDTMQPTMADPENPGSTKLIGDQLAGTVQDRVDNADGTVQIKIQGPGPGLRQNNTFQGGKLLHGTDLYEISKNDLDYVTIKLGGKPGPVRNNPVAIFQDEFATPTTLRANVASDVPLYRRLQPTTDSFRNVFAEAYIEPRLDTLVGVNINANNPGQPHTVPLHFDKYRDTKAPGYETDLFWVVYMSTAFEGLEDIQRVETMRGPDHPEYIGGDADGPAEQNSSRGYATGDISIVYMETALDLTPILQVADYYSVVGAHEIGHQLGLAAGDGADRFTRHRYDLVSVMTVTEQETALAAGRRFDTIPLHPTDIGWLRTRVHSPSSDPALQW